MDIERVKTFLEVRRTRHFGEAAENRYLTQAAVSARIRQPAAMAGDRLHCVKQFCYRFGWEKARCAAPPYLPW
jgi:hypothetical protein